MKTMASRNFSIISGETKVCMAVLGNMSGPALSFYFYFHYRFTFVG